MHVTGVWHCGECVRSAARNCRTETRLAILAVGLDPGLGIVHTDIRKKRVPFTSSWTMAMRVSWHQRIASRVMCPVWPRMTMRRTARWARGSRR
jgi:hypothetical protein